jgi:D-lactate dehydrogenase
MEVLMYDVAPAVGLENAHAKYVELDVLLSRADIISIHVPFLPENRHFLNADRIAKMKQGAYVINTARGELVDTDALLAALKDGKLGGAGLDVLEEERVLKLCRGHMEGLTPEEAAMVSADKTLMDMPNVIITPHVAYFSREANRDIQEISAGNVTAFINGAPTNVLA